jgi:hypothetical protein
MKNQKLAQIDGVTERYVPGVGATPVLRTFRVGYAALVAPTPGTGRYQPKYQPWTVSGPESVPAWTEVST